MLSLKPNHNRIAACHAFLAGRAAFHALLEGCAVLVNNGRANQWKLVPEYSLKITAGAKIATSFPEPLA